MTSIQANDAILRLVLECTRHICELEYVGLAGCPSVRPWVYPGLGMTASLVVFTFVWALSSPILRIHISSLACQLERITRSGGVSTTSPSGSEASIPWTGSGYNAHPTEGSPIRPWFKVGAR